MDCGPTCVRMISKYYGKAYSLQELRDRSYLTRDGVSLLGISEAAEYIGLKTLACKITSETLFSEAPLPAVLHWNQNHFVVIPPQNTNNKLIIIADPAYGIIKIDRQTFLNSWLGNDTKGTILLFEPTQRFFDEKGEKEIKTGFSFLFNYLKPYKRYLIQLMLSVLLAGLFSLIFPFLTQSLVDYGVNRQDVNYVYLILFSQLLVFLGNTIIEIIRSWILLHINTRININIISDFLIKLLNLPIRYFDTKMIGDIQQRIGDHQRVQNFLTGTTLSTLFSFVNLIVFSIVLAMYNRTILMIFLSFSIASIFWILIFLKRRKELDYKRFHRLSDNQNILFEMITGMQEIKLNNCETAKRWQWERTQAKLYKISIKGLALGQYQQVGSVFFTQLKNILISFISAKAVIDGQMSIGMMLSVSYIIGQMNGPLDQLLGFVQAAQDAKISLDRLGEIHEKEEEDKTFVEGQRQDVELLGSIRLENVSFQFEGPQSPFVLKNVNLTIPKGKVTAIVGSSGSGKTTLMKMLLQFYEPILGDISVGSRPFKLISPAYWRSKVGAVMQEGTVFSDSIANNISLSDERLDHRKLKNAVNIANIRDFIESLPNGYQTKIGNTGAGISTGQKQRLQIARAVYKDPDYLFFDEATSALDANNEKIIIENLEHFFKGKTVLVIAHRLSTVKHADQIVVLEKGEIVETGTHEELTAKRGLYFNLIRNQLELGA
jgi:ATP-binding cassette subfamily B protein